MASVFFFLLLLLSSSIDESMTPPARNAEKDWRKFRARNRMRTRKRYSNVSRDETKRERRGMEGKTSKVNSFDLLSLNPPSIISQCIFSRCSKTNVCATFAVLKFHFRSSKIKQMLGSRFARCTKIRSLLSRRFQLIKTVNLFPRRD